MELGLALGLKGRGGKAKHVIVGFEGDFYKRGNVEVIAARFGASVVEGLDAVIQQIEEVIERL